MIQYRKYIIARDGGACVLCDRRTKLHVHHIKTRGSGGTDDYRNLITLCEFCHQDRAHGVELAYYYQVFIAYTANFEVPDFWDEVMKLSKKAYQELLRKNRTIAKSRYQRQKSQWQSKLSPSMLKVLCSMMNKDWTSIEDYSKENSMSLWSTKANLQSLSKMTLDTFKIAKIGDQYKLILINKEAFQTWLQSEYPQSQRF